MYNHSLNAKKMPLTVKHIQCPFFYRILWWLSLCILAFVENTHAKMLFTVPCYYCSEWAHFEIICLSVEFCFPALSVHTDEVPPDPSLLQSEQSQLAQPLQARCGPVTSDAPQGMILGPVLYNIFIIDKDDGTGCTPSKSADNSGIQGLLGTPVLLNYLSRTLQIVCNVARILTRELHILIPPSFLAFCCTVLLSLGLNMVTPGEQTECLSLQALVI